MSILESCGYIADQMLKERGRQMVKWSLEHDDAHLAAGEFAGLIHAYAEQGRYLEAGALCIAAREAQLRSIDAKREDSQP